MKQTLSIQHTNEVLEEMCKRVGVDKDTFDFSHPEWYTKHTWSAQEEDDFRVWLGKFLTAHKYVGRGKKKGQNWGYYEAGKLLFNYGWKTNYDKNENV